MSEGDAPDPETPDRVLAVQFDDWPPLGGPLRLELGPERTVLVGRNAAGKSLLLEGIYLGSSAARARGGQSPPGFHGMTAEVELDRSRVTYAYTQRFEAPSDEQEGGWAWTERCVGAAVEELWRVEAGTAVFGDGRRMPVPFGVGLLALRDTADFPLPEPVRRLRRLLSGVDFMEAGVRRVWLLRQASRLVKQKWGWTSSGIYPSDSERLLAALLAWYEDEPGRYEALVEVCRRLQLFRTIDVRITPLSNRGPRGAPTQEGEVDIDGLNLGYLSDGTLRALRLVVRLLDPATTVLLLEEPEASVHPGLLHRLLAEIEAYTSDRQVVISTHSLAVVDWARPTDIRLVERNEGRTTVRPLDAGERDRLAAYLAEDLGMSEFLFSGALE